MVYLRASGRPTYKCPVGFFIGDLSGLLMCSVWFPKGIRMVFRMGFLLVALWVPCLVALWLQLAVLKGVLLVALWVSLWCPYGLPDACHMCVLLASLWAPYGFPDRCLLASLSLFPVPLWLPCWCSGCPSHFLMGACLVSLWVSFWFQYGCPSDSLMGFLLIALWLPLLFPCGFHASFLENLWLPGG